MSGDEKRRFKIVDNPDSSEGAAPLCLVSCETEQVVALGKTPAKLARVAFEEFGAVEVRHEEDLIEWEGV